MGAVAVQYRDFSDWYARLNTPLSPGARLPFARLLVNVAPAKRAAIAWEVRLTLTPKKGFPPNRVSFEEHRKADKR